MEYRRFVAYIVETSGEKKGANKGFIKVEQKEKSWHMQFQIKNLSKNTHLLWLYGLIRKDNRVLRKMLGQKAVSDGSCGMTYVGYESEDNIWSHADIGGLLFITDTGEWMQSLWSDDAWNVKELLEDSQKERESDKSILENESELVHNEQQEDKQQEDEQQEDEQQESEQQKSEQQEDKQQRKQGIEKEQDASSEQEEDGSVKTAEIQDNTQDNWKRIKAHFNSSPLNNDSVLGECVRITPDDLVYLRNQGWQIGNNGFILYGYGMYQHLLFCKNIEKQEFLLGVPGRLGVEEQFMASMFGFRHYKRTGIDEEGEEPMGYWYRTVPRWK